MTAGDLQASLRARVARLDPRTRIATVSLPRVGEGRTFRTAVAMPGEGLAAVREFGFKPRSGRSVGTVVAVRPREDGTEVDLHVTGDTAWTSLAGKRVRVDVRVAFAGATGANPHGGRVTGVEID